VLCAIAWLLAFYFARLSPQTRVSADERRAPSVRTTVAGATHQRSVLIHVVWAALSFTISGAIIGGALTAAIWLFDGVLDFDIRPYVTGQHDIRALLLVCFGVSIAMTAVFLGESIYTGLTSYAPWGDAEREWLARAG